MPPVARKARLVSSPLRRLRPLRALRVRVTPVMSCAPPLGRAAAVPRRFTSCLACSRLRRQHGGQRQRTPAHPGHRLRSGFSPAGFSPRARRRPPVRPQGGSPKAKSTPRLYALQGKISPCNASGSVFVREPSRVRCAAARPGRKTRRASTKTRRRLTEKTAFDAGGLRRRQ